MHPSHHTRAQRTLMIQGTTSDAGKSTLVAALCRLFVRRGVQVAPFKPQNMALNSAVTPEGGEIGRAQAVQAQAAGIAPHTDMNPVLLKPNSDISAQVIIHGQAIGNMDAVGYHRYKDVAMPAVLAAHARLTQQYALVVVEGAGSPAEINLRERDIANMGFAEAVDCPVILIADIDRGGVFAHLVGTLTLLSASEQQRVVGFVINRFRGDVSLLQPGIDWLQQHTGKPVLAVLPYLHGLHLQAEDALPQDTTAKTNARLTVIAPALPRISNHTDLDVLRLHPQVNFAFIAPNAAIPPADLIILPGSKSVRDDLTWLRQQGWDAALQRHLRYGGKLLGICGGMQMLGTLIDDPLGIEGTPGQTPGLGYVELQTTLAAHKQLRQVTGELLLGSSRAALCGYEIHAGVSRGRALLHPLVQIGAQVDGCIAAEGQIIGTYVHGLFDTPTACAALLSWAGLHHASEFDYHAHNEAELNRLADAVASQLDWPLLQRALQPWLDDAVLRACCYDAALC